MDPNNPQTETWQKPRGLGSKLLRLVILLVVLALIAAAGWWLYGKYGHTGPDKTVEAPPTAIVKITDKGFEPTSLTVKKGTVVIWKASGNTKPVVVAANPYPTNDSLEGLKSEQLGSGAEYRYKFNESGTFNYHDNLNPTVNGTVIVE